MSAQNLFENALAFGEYATDELVKYSVFQNYRFTPEQYFEAARLAGPYAIYDLERVAKIGFVFTPEQYLAAALLAGSDATLHLKRVSEKIRVRFTPEQRLSAAIPGATTRFLTIISRKLRSLPLHVLEKILDLVAE